MKTTLRQLDKALERIADAHVQVADYFWGDFADSFEGRVQKYPAIIANVSTPIPFGKVTTVQLNLICVDQVGTNNQRLLNEVESDTLQILQDFFRTMKHSPNWREFGVVSSANADLKFKIDSPDEVAGWKVTYLVKLMESEGLCDLPLIDYDFDAPVCQIPDDFDLCKPVTYRNSDDTFTGSVASGGHLQLEDVDNVDTNGTIVPTPAQTPFICSPGVCGDGTATNSDNSVSISVPSGGIEVFPDGSVTITRGGDTILFSQAYPAGANTVIPIEDIVVFEFMQETIDFMTVLGVPFDEGVSYPMGAGTMTGVQFWNNIESLIFLLKSGGYWDRSYMLFPFMGGTAFMHSVNLRYPYNTSLRLVFFGGVTHDGFGSHFNGVNGYAKTGFINPNSDLASGLSGLGADLSASVYSRNDIIAGRSVFGTGSIAGTNDGFATQVSNGTIYFCPNGTAFSTANNFGGNTRGWLTFSRNNRESQTFYKFRTPSPSYGFEFARPLDTVIPAVEFYLAANNQNGAAGINANLSASFFRIGAGISYSDDSGMYSIVENTQSALNRGAV